MAAAIAIYDMDKTVTRKATFTPFLFHAAWRLAPLRFLLLPLVLLATARHRVERAPGGLSGS